MSLQELLVQIPDYPKPGWEYRVGSKPKTLRWRNADPSWQEVGEVKRQAPNGDEILTVLGREIPKPPPPPPEPSPQRVKEAAQRVKTVLRTNKKEKKSGSRKY